MIHRLQYPKLPWTILCLQQRVYKEVSRFMHCPKIARLRLVEKSGQLKDEKFQVERASLKGYSQQPISQNVGEKARIEKIRFADIPHTVICARRNRSRRMENQFVRLTLYGKLLYILYGTACTLKLLLKKSAFEKEIAWEIGQIGYFTVLRPEFIVQSPAIFHFESRRVGVVTIQPSRAPYPKVGGRERGKTTRENKMLTRIRPPQARTEKKWKFTQ